MSTQLYVALRDHCLRSGAIKIATGTLVELIGGGPQLDLKKAKADEMALALVKTPDGRTYIVNPLAFSLATNKLWLVCGTRLVNIVSTSRRKKPDSFPPEWNNQVVVLRNGRWMLVLLDPMTEPMAAAFIGVPMQ